MATRARKISTPTIPEFDPTTLIPGFTFLQYFMGGVAAAAMTGFAACNAFDIWDRPFPRGCMLIIADDMLIISVLGGLAAVIAFSALTSIRHSVPRWPGTYGFMFLVTVFCIGYAALTAANAHHVYRIFASCRVADTRSEPCNLKTENASVAQLIRISNLLEDMRAWPFENPNEWQAKPGTRNR